MTPSAFPPLRHLPAMSCAYALTVAIGWVVWPAFCAVVQHVEHLIGA
jgi:hypothetical protein